MGNKERETSSARKISRAKYRCPPELDAIIQMIRLVQPKTPLIPFAEIYADEIKKEQDECGGLGVFIFGNHPEVALERILSKQFPDTPLAILKRSIQHTPQEFQDYIMKNPEYKSSSLLSNEEGLPDELLQESIDATINFVKSMRKYIKFYNTRLSLHILVLQLEEERLSKSPGINSIHWDWFPIALTTTVERGFDGKLHITGLASLLGTFDDSRLRKCKICNHIFWAKREDSNTCSLRCLNTFNVRRSRSLTDEEKAERKAKREANREIIKTGKAKQKKRSK